MIVRLTAEAERDLEEIADAIARDDPRRALSFVQELRGKCLALVDLPRGFPRVERFLHAEVRRRVHGNYLIFYRIEPAAVVVLHILHGARDYDAVLSSD